MMKEKFGLISEMKGERISLSLSLSLSLSEGQDNHMRISFKIPPMVSKFKDEEV